MQESSRVYYPALTGYRAIAAYLVFFYHVNPFSTTSFFGAVVNELHVGVSMFFVLSGFLIYSRYKNLSLSDSFAWRNYLQNRMARIYPLYFFLTTLTFIVFYFYKPYPDVGFEYIMNITFLKGFFDDLKFTGIAQGWSLTTEECFYLAAPFIFMWLKKIRIEIITVSIVLSGVVLVLIFGSLDFYGFFSDFSFMFTYTFFGRAFEFLIGVWLAKRIIERNTIKPFFQLTWLGLISMGIVIMLMAFVRTGFTSEPGVTLLNNFVLPLTIAVLIYGLATESTFLSRLLSQPLSQLLGKSSYAFYLIHVGIFYTALHRYVTENTIIIFIALNLIAIFLYQFIERPLNEKWKAKSI